MKYIKTITWDEAFDFWRENEAGRKNWIEHYKSKGFESWDDWRINYSKAFGCDKKKWVLYKLDNTKKEVPLFLGGPFKGWIDGPYNGKKFLMFSDLAKLPKVYNYKKIKDIIKNFPPKTILLGLKVKNEIVIIEGMHRCCAIAIMAKRGEKIKNDVMIALADHLNVELPVVGKFTKKTNG